LLKKTKKLHPKGSKLLFASFRQVGVVWGRNPTKNDLLVMDTRAKDYERIKFKKVWLQGGITERYKIVFFVFGVS
jgi:hypothetical protein